MINLPLNEWWLPILAFIPIGVAVVRIKKKKKITKDAWFEFAIGVFVLLLSVNDNLNNATERRNNSDSLTQVHTEVKNLNDTLHTTKDTLLKVGLEIDAKTGKLLIIDSQLLKQRVFKIINNNIYSNGNDKKLPNIFLI